MAIITYNTETSLNCIFSSKGNISETKEKLAYIMEGVEYTVISTEEES